MALYTVMPVIIYARQPLSTQPTFTSLSPMPDQPLHSPAEAAKLISRPPLDKPVNVYTLRRWCGQHAEYLSPGANPNSEKEGDAPDAARWLTDRDIEVLRTVAQLRAEGMTTPAINAKLATLSFAVAVEQDEQAGAIEVDKVVDNDERPMAMVATTPTTELEARLVAVEKHIARNDHEAGARLQFGVNMLVLGVILGVVLVIALRLLQMGLGI